MYTWHLNHVYKGNQKAPAVEFTFRTQFITRAWFKFDSHPQCQCAVHLSEEFDWLVMKQEGENTLKFLVVGYGCIQCEELALLHYMFRMSRRYLTMNGRCGIQWTIWHFWEKSLASTYEIGHHCMQIRQPCHSDI